MEPLLLFVLAGGVAAALAISAEQRRQRTAAIWRRSAEACGLTDLQPSSDRLRGRLPQAHGREDIGVTIARYQRSRSDKGTRLVLETPVSRLAGMALRGESLITDLRRMLGASEIEVGDPDFDARFFLAGAMAPSLAFFDAEMRRLLTDVKPACRRMEIARGMLEVDIHEDVDMETVLPTVLYRMLEIGRRWPHHSETAARIAHNTLRDPHPSVRLHNLLLLTREMAEEPIAQEALRAACDDPLPQIRLRAATALGARGHEVLFALAEGPDDEVAGQAIGALGRWLPPERTMTILDDAIRTRRDATAAACIALLGRTGGDAAVTRLTRIVAGGLDHLKLAAVEALGWSGRAAAEAPLVGALRHALPEVRRAAAAALGQVGTVASVLPLEEAAERDSALRSTVRQSIVAIQSRASGASPGQLSLAGGETGQLSLAAGDAGQVSLADQAGRLSATDPEKPR